MTAPEKIDQLIAGLNDWRGETLATVRRIILAADPEIVEEWKWMGSPVWSRDGMIAVGNAHKDKVKLTFQQGASLPDPRGLFNATLGGGTWRAIDWGAGARVDADALQDLVRAAIAHNRNRMKPRAPAPRVAKTAKSTQ